MGRTSEQEDDAAAKKVAAASSRLTQAKKPKGEVASAAPGIGQPKQGEPPTKVAPANAAFCFGCSKKLFTLLDLCVSSLRRGHANLLCIVPMLLGIARQLTGIARTCQTIAETARTFY